MRRRVKQRAAIVVEAVLKPLGPFEIAPLLRVAVGQDERPLFGRVGLLTSLADVAAARRETPKFPAPACDYRREAIRAMDGLNVDRLNDAGVEVIATAIHGTTAALLHLADTVARTNTTV
ncbi:hypothetical protein [Streptomyces phaeochromogenes]|uniref:hypothetical protein n=1 Tax=Streptomyces phaeochromogenes TaxID=1923 RepID=UPI003870528A|nr:hypothetical protein OG478_00975 [Streptomyces phaeochromogenes]WSW11673.1 hypothetical protein OG277_00715 [Streptomyces phaeochromogenes]WTA01282.1 hypothetical protein OHB08_02445 [Streptomyces phaeochromogenes]